MSPAMPPLPAAWPYAPRGPQAPLERIGDAAVPGLGEGWTLHLRAGWSLAGEPGELPRAYGRGGIRRLGETVVRPYRRGGLLRHLNGRIYASPARFSEECAAHRALWEAGFPTVEPLGYAHRPLGWGVEGLFLTRFAPTRPWPSCWERSADVVPQVHRLLEALAAWGLLAPDLNATNVLIADDGQVLALDWDRARWTGGDLRPRYRERLLRSLQKLQAPPDVLAAFR